MKAFGCLLWSEKAIWKRLTPRKKVKGAGVGYVHNHTPTVQHIQNKQPIIRRFSGSYW